MPSKLKSLDTWVLGLNRRLVADLSSHAIPFSLLNSSDFLIHTCPGKWYQTAILIIYAVQTAPNRIFAFWFFHQSLIFFARFRYPSVFGVLRLLRENRQSSRNEQNSCFPGLTAPVSAGHTLQGRSRRSPEEIG